MVGGRICTCSMSNEELNDDGILNVFDRTKRQARTEKMVHHMKCTGNLGSALFAEEHISNYANGDGFISMKDLQAEKILINVHDDGRETAKLFASAFFPRLFGIISDDDATKWLKGKKPKTWTLATVALNMQQFLETFETDKENRCVKKSDAIKKLSYTRRTRDAYNKGLHKLITTSKRRAVCECACRKLRTMFDLANERSLAYHAEISSDVRFNDKKSDY